MTTVKIVWGMDEPWRTKDKLLNKKTTHQNIPEPATPQSESQFDQIGQEISNKYLHNHWIISSYTHILIGTIFSKFSQYMSAWQCRDLYIMRQSSAVRCRAWERMLLAALCISINQRKYFIKICICNWSKTLHKIRVIDWINSHMVTCLKRLLAISNIK